MPTPFGICHEIHSARPLMTTVKEPHSTTRNDKFGSECRFFRRFGTAPAMLGNLNLAYVLLLSKGDSSSTYPCEEGDSEQEGITARATRR